MSKKIFYLDTTIWFSFLGLFLTIFKFGSHYSNLDMFLYNN